MQIGDYKFERFSGVWREVVDEFPDETFQVPKVMCLALDEIEESRKSVSDATHKLTCVAIERQCDGIPEIVRVCVQQAEFILSELIEKVRMRCDSASSKG